MGVVFEGTRADGSFEKREAIKILRQTITFCAASSMSAAFWRSWIIRILRPSSRPEPLPRAIRTSS